MSYGLNFELAVSGRGSRLNTLSCLCFHLLDLTVGPLDPCEIYNSKV